MTRLAFLLLLSLSLLQGQKKEHVSLDANGYSCRILGFKTWKQKQEKGGDMVVFTLATVRTLLSSCIFLRLDHSWRAYTTHRACVEPGSNVLSSLHFQVRIIHASKQASKQASSKGKQSVFWELASPFDSDGMPAERLFRSANVNSS